jgi:hypothetical protein
LNGVSGKRPTPKRNALAPISKFLPDSLTVDATPKNDPSNLPYNRFSRRR